MFGRKEEEKIPTHPRVLLREPLYIIMIYNIKHT
jgi:hypothetical protein